MVPKFNTPWAWLLLAGLVPLFGLMFDAFADRLGSNAIQALHLRLGDWSLRFLWLTLAVTPLQTVTNWRGMADYRQLLGLYSFFYATLHLLGYLFADHAGHWQTIAIDIAQSSYLWLGLLAYGILFLLALTSSKVAKKRLGKNWKKLHRWIYPAAMAAIAHYFWQLKGNLLEPLFYLLIVLMLLGFRVAVWYKNRQLSRLMLPVGRLPAGEDKHQA